MDDVIQLDLDEFKQQRFAYDDAVAQTLRIDPFCTSSNWILPSHHALMKPIRTLIFRCGDQRGSNFLLLCQSQISDWGKVWTPFEASWALGSPAVGENTLPLWRAFSDLLVRERGEWDGVFLCGLPTIGSLWHQCLHGFDRQFKLYQNQTWLRCVASLEGGSEGYLARRTSKFRKNLRRALRRASDAGIEVVALPAPDSEAAAEALLDRALAIEKRSWKGVEANGILNAEMEAFYRSMFKLLVPRRMLRFSVARLAGEDIGYIFGAVMGRRYRGLQFSYDNQYREFSIGSLMQWHAIQSCCEEGVALYDLGMDMDYKYQWSEMTMASSGLIIHEHR